MKPGLVLALAAVVSCATPRDASQAQPSSSAQAEQPAVPAAAPAPAAPAAPDPVPPAAADAVPPAAPAPSGPRRRDATGSQGPGSVAGANRAPLGPPGLLGHGSLARDAVPPLPPSEGGLAFAAAGCAKASGEEGGARHPPPPRTRRAALVSIRPLAGGVAISHEVTHACCLGASATSRIEGRTVVVTERLSGTPCRCVCASTLRSAVRLPAGSWNVVLELDTNGSVKRVGSQEVRIR